eukprot:1714062-Prymnesium_polylepis.1
MHHGCYHGTMSSKKGARSIYPTIPAFVSNANVRFLFRFHADFTITFVISTESRESRHDTGPLGAGT